jgi:hypothetical protein
VSSWGFFALGKRKTVTDSPLTTRYADKDNGAMPRVGRFVIPDCPHYVTQRRNNRHDVLFAPSPARPAVGWEGKEEEQK